MSLSSSAALRRMTPSGPSMSSPPPASPAETLPRGAIACLALTAFGSGMSLRINDAMLPQLAREFGVSVGQASQKSAQQSP